VTVLKPVDALASSTDGVESAVKVTEQELRDSGLPETSCTILVADQAVWVRAFDRVHLHPMTVPTAGSYSIYLLSPYWNNLTPREKKKTSLI
jgi:hypothetical protein